MTRLEALTALRDKVKRGVDTAHDHAAVFPSESAGGHCTWHDSHKASSGSLNAAKTLHQVLLPEWEYVIGIDWARVTHVSGSHSFTTNSEHGDAHAWVLALLEALIQMEGTDG